MRENWKQTTVLPEKPSVLSPQSSPQALKQEASLHSPAFLGEEVLKHEQFFHLVKKKRNLPGVAPPSRSSPVLCTSRSTRKDIKDIRGTTTQSPINETGCVGGKDQRANGSTRKRVEWGDRQPRLEQGATSEAAPQLGAVQAARSENPTWTRPSASCLLFALGEGSGLTWKPTPQRPARQPGRGAHAYAPRSIPGD